MEQIDFKQAIASLSETGHYITPSHVHIAIPDARKQLSRGIAHFTGPQAKWLPAYDRVAAWLTDNHSRGLLCYGNCGTGKSLICQRIIPLLIHHYCRWIVSSYDATQLNSKLDEIKRKHIIYIDDIGIEGICNNYGEKRMAFPEIVYEAERRGSLIIVTTNLSLDEIQAKYGLRVVDRLVAITTRVLFKGESFRK